MTTGRKTSHRVQTRKAHSVPQVYLRYFTSTSDVCIRNPIAAKIWRFNKTTQKADQAKIAAVAHQRDLYTYHWGREDMVSFEETFSRWEGGYAQVLRELHAAPHINTLLERKDALASFVAFQYLRTTLMQDLVRQYWELLDANQLGAEHPRPEKDEIKIGHMSLIVRDLDRAADIFRRKNWVLLHNDTDELFYSSDTPVTAVNPLRGRRTPDLLPISNGVEMHFPLSPRLALLMYNRGEYRDEQFESIAELEDVAAINRQQVWWSQRYLFSAANNFEMADKMTSGWAELKNPRRQRIFWPGA